MFTSDGHHTRTMRAVVGVVAERRDSVQTAWILGEMQVVGVFFWFAVKKNRARLPLEW